MKKQFQTSLATALFVGMALIAVRLSVENGCARPANESEMAAQRYTLTDLGPGADAELIYHDKGAWSEANGAFSAQALALLSGRKEAWKGAVPHQHIYSRNRFGQAVGIARTPGRGFLAFLWQDGRRRLLESPGGVSSRAFDINETGQVVGYGGLKNHACHALLWDTACESHDLGTLGGGLSHAYAINNPGQIAGDADTAEERTHAFLYNNGKMQDLDTRNSLISHARSLNDAGQVVGTFLAPQEGEMHACLWEKGAMIDLNRVVPHKGWILRDAVEINTAGQIFGVGFLNGESRFFALTPIP